MQPHWRPDFRIPGTLPDIKIIRTDFIINSIAGTIALIMLFLVGQREFRAHTLDNSIAETERRIRLAEADDNIHLKLSEDFRSAANYVVEVDTFYDSPALAHEVVLDLMSLKPEGLIFDRVAMVEQVVTRDKAAVVEYRITINGEVRELTVLDAFKSALGASELLNPPGYRSQIDEALEGRDPQTGIFPYRLTILLMPAAGESEEKKGAES